MYSSFLNRFRWPDFLFYLFILLILGNRILLYLHLNLDHIDSDQPIMWLAAKHFSEGLFFEPRFYGQNYNTMMEALLAVPFIKLGMPVYYAVPLVTHLLFLTPFLFTAGYLFLVDKKIQSIIVLTILLLLPSGYDILNALPRGFVTGIFFTSPFILGIHKPGHAKLILLNTFCACVAYLVNQNSLLVSVPFLFYIFLHNYKSKKYYLFSAIAILAALPLHYFLDHFYTLHPEYIQHSLENHFSGYFFIEAIKSLDKRFAHITFFEDGKCIYVLFVLFLAGFLFLKKDRKVFYAYLLFLMFILASFFSSKIADGVAWPFYSYSRMYLGIPVILYLFLSLIQGYSTKLLYFLVPTVLLFTSYKELNLKKNIAIHTNEKRWFFIHLSSLKNTRELVNHYNNLCKKHDVKNFVVAKDIWAREELAYGGQALLNDFPNTLMTVGERRTWRIAEERKKVHDRFIMLSTDYDFDEKGFDSLFHFKITRLDYYGCFLIENNKKTLPGFLDATGSPINGIIEK